MDSSKKVLNASGVQWPGEEESLTLIAMLPLELLELSGLLDSLGDRLDSERLS